jgi:hypothetical protein
MLKSVAKLVGYSKAPKASFMLMHPVRGTKALVAAKGVKGLVTSRAGAALAGMVIVPIGLAALGARARR